MALIVVVFIVGGIATAMIFGDSDEAYWGFTLCFMVFAPVALLTGFTLAVKRFVRNRRVLLDDAATFEKKKVA